MDSFFSSLEFLTLRFSTSYPHLSAYSFKLNDTLNFSALFLNSQLELNKANLQIAKLKSLWVLIPIVPFDLSNRLMDKEIL